MDQGYQEPSFQHRNISPLWIMPLIEHGVDCDASTGNSSTTKGHYNTLQRLVTCAPNLGFLESTPFGEIETSLEEYIGSDGTCLWRRVAVRGGKGANRVLHASFALPESERTTCGSGEAMDEPVMCWASFPERPKHKLLCVLANPSLLYIWDVYPFKVEGIRESVGGGEGHSVTVPFEARAIFPLGSHHGLLIQRSQSVDDQLLYDSTWAMSGASEDDDDDDCFDLANPPKPVRLGSILASSSGVEMAISPSSTNQMETNMMATPSIFSMEHPLADILPVYKLHEQSPPTLFSDANEKIIFVDTLRWTDHEDGPYEKQEYSQPICVTYHMLHKRHVIWAIKSAPPPPSTPPLWQVSRNERCEKGLRDQFALINESHVVGEGDLELLGLKDHDSSRYEAISRNEALADALGVRTTRKTEEATTNRVRSGRDVARRSGGLPAPASLFLSPPPTVRDVISKESKKQTRVLTSIDQSAQQMDEAEAGIPTSSPFSELHPGVSMIAVYDESTSIDSSYGEATQAFLASNLDGSGTLVLCLLCPLDDNSNPSTLRCFTVRPIRNNDLSTIKISPASIGCLRHRISVQSLTTLPCISAQPVQATPVPQCFSPHVGCTGQKVLSEQLATDILVVQKHSGLPRNELKLYRAGFHIVDCALSGSPDLILPRTEETDFHNITRVENSVGDRVDFIHIKRNGERVKTRGRVSLRFSASALSEMSLAVIDTALFAAHVSHPIRSMQLIGRALSIRADCIRLAQTLLAEDDSIPFVDDLEWLAVDCVLSEIIDHELFGDSAGARQAGDISRDEAWTLLLESQFDRTYNTENGSKIFLGFDERDEILASGGNDNQMSRLLTKIGSLSLACRRRHEVDANGQDHSHAARLDGTPELVHSIFDSLHLLYEDSKLFRGSMRSSWLRMLGSLLARICLQVESAPQWLEVSEPRVHCIIGDFLDHYRRDLGTTWLQRIEDVIVPRLAVALSVDARDHFRSVVTSFARPPCLLSWLDILMRHNGHGVDGMNDLYAQCAVIDINAACRRSRALLRLFTALLCEKEPSFSQRERDHSVVTIMIDEGMTSALDIRDELPAGLALPLLEVLNRCRGDPDISMTSVWPLAAWSLIGREDLNKLYGSHLGRHRNSATQMERSRKPIDDMDKDGIVPLESTSSMLFPDDNRIREVGRMLRSSRPTYLKVSRAMEVSDHDYERLKQERLMILCRRVLAVPVGRGMLTLGTLQPLPAEPLPLPELCLTGRVPPTNANLALDISTCPSDFKVWPEFHNGVASGLRLGYVGDSVKDTIHQVTRTWIVYNRDANTDAVPQQAASNGAPTEPAESSSQPSHAHGGLLMALGLRGHLSTLSMTDIYDYLTQGTVTTTVGILLGMAANERGSCDPSVSKMLCLHIPSLLPQSFAAIDVASPAQAAAVAGIGLLYQGSSHRLMTEFLMNEIGRRPVNDMNNVDREAYTLSCGLALGMVNLAQGDSASGINTNGRGAGLADLDLEQRLFRFIVGGIDFMEKGRRQEALDRSSNATGVVVSEGERCSRVFEGDMVNTDVTAPGATLALGLIYLKTGNKAVASSLALPDTHFLMAYVRPDLLLLRVIARSLILWDDVHPSDEWVENQIPNVVKSAYHRMRDEAAKASDFSNLSGFRSPLNESVPQRSDRRNNHASPTHEGNEVQREQEGGLRSDHEIDRQSVRQVYAHILAGACFSIGLRYAGTGHEDAKAAVSQRIVELRTLRDENDPVSIALRPEQSILDMCLGCASISLALVMAGTGDLESLRLLKIVRWRCDDAVKYGSHMAYGAAIGLIFLGGCTYTLGRDPEDIAALVTAFFPRFPSTTGDNQYHLQALRHFYALAVKPRKLEAIDVDSGDTVFVPIEVDFGIGVPLELRTPCLLVNTNLACCRLRVVSQRYFPLTLDLIGDEGRTFFVKKRSGHLSYSQDPHSQRSLLVQTGSSSGQSVLGLVKSFTEDPRIISYAKHLCDSEPSGFQNSAIGSSSWVSSFCSRVLHECLTNDTEEALPLYLSLRASMELMDIDFPGSVRSVWDFRLIRSYYEKRRILLDANGRCQQLLSADFVSHLIETMDRIFSSTELDEKDVLVYMKSGARRTSVRNSDGMFGAFLVWYDIPFPRKRTGSRDIDGMDLS